MTQRKSAFAAIVGPATRALILGSLPGERSLAVGQYYAHPRNQFWHLVGAVIDQPDLTTLPYSDRLVAVQQAGIGLWDVYASAERRGSLDAAIRAGEAAPLRELARSLPALRVVAFNGRAAATAGHRALGGGPWALLDLPSSSPALAVLSLADKRDRWLALRRYITVPPPP